VVLAVTLFAPQDVRGAVRVALAAQRVLQVLSLLALLAQKYKF
jgi:hypothetical protein